MNALICLLAAIVFGVIAYLNYGNWFIFVNALGLFILFAIPAWIEFRADQRPRKEI